MISRNLYLNLLFRVLLIVAFSLLFGFLMFRGQNLRLLVLIGAVIVFVTTNLVLYVNSTNRKIRYFFDAVKNDDSSLRFPQDVKNPAVREIHRGMNRVNEQIQLLKIEITQQEQFFRTLLEHLATGILTYNEKGFIIHVNTAAKRLLSLDVITHIQQIKRVDSKLYSAISSIRPSEHRLVPYNTGQGEIQLSLKATSFTPAEGNMTILSIQDIKNELDEKEIESWMKLIRVLMHEIMNSITPITSLSESLSNIYSDGEKPVSPEKITKATITTTLNGLNVIREQGRGLKSFVDSYRRLTRLPEPEKSVFRIRELLNRVRLLYESLDNNQDAELIIIPGDPDLEVFADQNMISQVLINLVKNALEAGGEKTGGVISVSSGKGDSGRTEICVADNGPGIPQANLDRIFDPFFTTKPVGEGNGLGLSICFGIIQRMGGEIDVESTVNVGTRFTIRLPLENPVTSKN